jgi:hypothetical protein
MLHFGCETCDRLWREYVQATHAHLRILGKQRIASIQQDSSALRVLDPEERDAAQLRDDAHAAVKAHDMEHSPKVMSAR